jgi:glycosyltransferase involved in cell wall biosynthesis
MGPLVSVVIPTRNRPELVVRAVRSALAQTYLNLEVIVVIDGPDTETATRLAEFVRNSGERRLKIHELPENVGGCRVRNIGIQSALGEWVAMLDDDDEWNPDKLVVQLSIAEKSGYEHPIVACRALVDRGRVTTIWPTRQPSPGEPLSEYIFCRRGIGYGEALLITSMLLARRSLFIAVPFSDSARRHQDSDWALRALQAPGTALLWAWEPLITFDHDVATASISRSMNPLPSLEWLHGNDLLTPKARAYFMATQVAPRTSPLKQPLLGLKSIAASLREPWALLLSMLFLFTTPRMRHAVQLRA